MARASDGSRIPPDLREQMTPEVLAFVEALLAKIDALQARVAEWEAKFGKTPQNSSLPPSSQHPHAKPLRPQQPSGKRPGGQPGHPKFERALVPPDQVTQTITLKPPECRRCGRRLEGSDPDPRPYQVWELPEIRPIITEYQRHRLTCPDCGTTTTAPLPAGVPEGQTGARLAAFVVDTIFVASGQAVLLAPVAWYWWARETPRAPSDVALLPVIASVTLLPLALVLGVLYHVYFWSVKGATPGKELLDLRVVTDDGVSPIPLASALRRALGYLLSAASLGLGFLMVIFGGRGLHDRIASTRVVKGRHR